MFDTLGFVETNEHTAAMQLTSRTLKMNTKNSTFAVNFDLSIQKVLHNCLGNPGILYGIVTKS
jgi:Leu/Phe-tRNA-protein transferase